MFVVTNPEGTAYRNPQRKRWDHPRNLRNQVPSGATQDGHLIENGRRKVATGYISTAARPMCRPYVTYFSSLDRVPTRSVVGCDLSPLGDSRNHTKNLGNQRALV
jgi:hypothetical protein